MRLVLLLLTSLFVARAGMAQEPPTLPPVEFILAPNPYRAAEATGGFQLRVRSEVADLTVLYAEIYDLSGQRIHRIEGTELGLGRSGIVPGRRTVTSRAWWDLQTGTGDDVPTGTYWVRFVAEQARYGRIEGRRVERLIKFVVVR